jgi:hypothetical protein
MVGGSWPLQNFLVCILFARGHFSKPSFVGANVMNMKWYLAATAGLAGWLMAADGQAQTKYTLKIRDIAPGESARVELKDTSVFKTKTVVEKEKDTGKFDESKIAKHFLYTETVLERPAGAVLATKLKRTYDKAEMKGRLNPFDKDAPAELPLQGKTVLIEKKGPRYEFRKESGDALEDPTLTGEFNSPDAEHPKWTFLPKGAVAEGETWKYEPKELLAGFGKSDKVDVRKAAGSAKLVKVTKKDGRLYGVIEINAEVDLKVTTDDKELKGTLIAENKLKMKLTFEGCIDGSFTDSRQHGTMEFSAVTVFRPTGEPAVTSYSNGTSDVDESWKQLPKK